MMIPPKMEENLHKKDQRFAAIFTASVLCGMFVLCYFIVVWSPPDPPIPEYGMEVNFGVDEAGFEKVQNSQPAHQSTQEAKTAPQPAVDPTSQQVNVPEPIKSIQPLITPTEVFEKEAVVAEKVEKSQHEEKNQKEEKYPIKENPDTQAEGAKSSNTGKTPESQANNNGNVHGAVGDQGSKNGTMTSENFLKSQGGKGGSSLDMPGWRWLSKPQVKDNSPETGKIVFRVIIDDNGEVTSVSTEYCSVSKSVANLYENAIRRLQFEMTNVHADAPEETIGKITFIITSK